MPLLPKERVKVKMIVTKGQVESLQKILRKNLVCIMDMIIAPKVFNALTKGTRVLSQGNLGKRQDFRVQVPPLSLPSPILLV